MSMDSTVSQFAFEQEEEAKGKGKKTVNHLVLEPEGEGEGDVRELQWTGIMRDSPVAASFHSTVQSGLHISTSGTAARSVTSYYGNSSMRVSRVEAAMDNDVTSIYDGSSLSESISYSSGSSSGFDSGIYGKRKALLIGISYINSSTPSEGQRRPLTLPGSHEDVDAMKAFLMQSSGWPEESFTILKDDPSFNLYWQPTRANIEREIDELVYDASAGDHLFLHFSGHGSQIQDLDDDEEDGMDEVIWTSDHQHIVDDELHEKLVRRIPAGCQMTVVFDCCSSGTGLDLPFFPAGENWLPDIDELSLGAEDGSGSYPGSTMQSPINVTVLPPTPLPPSAGLYPGRQKVLRRKQGPRHHYTDPVRSIQQQIVQATAKSLTYGHRPAVRRKYSSGNVVMWASCRDGEASGEVYVWREQKNRGAMTQAFIESMSALSSPTYFQLLDCIKLRMKSYQLQQHVQLSSSFEIDMNSRVEI